MLIDLGALYREIAQELRAAELRAAELRGQVQLIERLMRDAQRPIMSGDPLAGQDALETTTNGATTGPVGPLVPGYP